MRHTLETNIVRSTVVLVMFAGSVFTPGNAAFAQSCPSGVPVFSQSCVGGGDPATDKQNCLGTASPNITLKDSAQIGGTLWPTLIQTECFLKQYPGPMPLVITSGTDNHRPSPSGVGHAEGLKVDLRITNTTDTYADSLSNFVLRHASTYFGPNGKGGTKDCRSDGAPWYNDSNNVIFAMEFPHPILGTAGYLGPSDCTVRDQNGNDQATPPIGSDYLDPGHCCHWDVLSSYNGLSVTPSSLTVKVGEFMSISPVATANGQAISGMQPWMFEYNTPSDPSQTIAAVDSTGLITGTAGSIIGVTVGTSVLVVSEGQFDQFITIDVQQPDPPGGGPVCQGPQAQWSACWNWDNTAGAWIWYPSPNNPGGPNPPGNPPAPGACASPPVGPCWEWDPTANGGAGAWIFVQPSSGSSGGGTSPPITPVGSTDPNAISGPPGVGAAQFIQGANPVAYTIFFENEPTATAPAQKVVVTDQLDGSRFDLSTVTLGPITLPGTPGVSPQAIPLQILGGFSTQVDLRPANNLLVNITASLNSGLLTWTLQSLDPSTGLPPADPLLGLLPPGAEGSISFLVQPNSSLATGAVLNDQGTVVFDANPPLSTAVWSNTIDSAAPTSHITALEATQSHLGFPVSWQGSDMGSGVLDFTIYVSDNGGPFVPFQMNTTASSATFIGKAGHAYGFYSVARDLVGNIEAAKTAAEATTRVVIDTTPPVIVPQLTGTLGNNGWYRSNVTVSWTVTDPESGIASSSGCTATILTADTAGVTLTCAATNGAGLSTSVPVTIKIDKTPPILTVTANPPPNSNGWNNSNLTVSFAAVDALSGVGVVSAPVTVTQEGAGQIVSGSATDLAGNLTIGSVTLNLDKTPPEAFNQFDPVAYDVVLFGRDSLSGVAPGPVQPLSVVLLRRDDDKDDDDDRRFRDDDNLKIELRTYQVLDLAGNSLTLVEKVKKQGQHIKVRMMSLQYGQGPVIALPRNRQNFAWELAEDGSLKELDEELSIDAEKNDQRVEAEFNARRNRTIVVKEEPEPKTRVTRSGLDLLRLATSAGKLTIEF